MSEEDDLIKELEKLSTESRSSVLVDSTVENKVNYEGRKKLLQGLYLINGKLAKGLALSTLVPGEKPIVRSHPSLAPPHNISQEIETNSARLTMPLRIDGPSALGGLDNKFDRTLTFDEFTSRFEILVKKIEEGKLDDKLGFQAEVIIHGIMGLSGELLGRLGIDPKKGETYELLEGEMRPVESEVKPFDLITPTKQILDAIVRARASVASAAASKRSANIDYSDVTEGIPITNTSVGDSKVPKAIPVMHVRNIGVVIFTLTDEIASDMGLLNGTRGVLVIGVLKNSIAEKAGLRTGTKTATFGGTAGMLGGDVIIGVGDKAINNLIEFVNYLSHYHTPGTQIKLKILRHKEPIEMTLIY